MDRRLLGAVFVALATAFIWLCTTWVCDDAYVVFRVVRNLLAGEGLVWNIGYRVQVFTDPLWLMLIAGVTHVTGEPDDAAFLVSVVCAVLTVTGLFLAVARQCVWTATAMVMVIWSSPVLMYLMSSGLETPLLGVLLAAFVYVAWFTPERSAALGLLCGLMVLTRPDAVVLAGPLLWHVARGHGGRWWQAPVIRTFVVPVAGWAAFATVYFGSPVPNTYWAKMGHGDSKFRVLYEGGLYLLRNALIDPWLPLSVLVLVGLAWRGGGELSDPKLSLVRASVAGVLLHLLYVVWVGGDWLVGRFAFTSMLLATGTVAMAMSLMGNATQRRRFALVVMAMSMVSTLVYRNPLRDGLRVAIDLPVVMDDGMWPRWGPFHSAEPVLVVDGTRRVEVIDAAGSRPYRHDPDVVYVDTFAIADPLMSRMGGRLSHAGHADREVPAGYVDVLGGQRDRLEDPDVHAFYEHVRRLHTGPFFTVERWTSMVYLLVLRPTMSERRYGWNIPHVRPLELPRPNLVLSATMPD